MAISLPHDERYARTDEYVEILRRIWTADKPVDHEGKYYKFLRSFSDVKPLQKPHVPIYFGGSSMPRSQLPGSMPTSMRCGASRWPRRPRPSRRCAHRRRGMDARCGSACQRGQSWRPPKTRRGRARGASSKRVREIRGRAMLGAPRKAPQAVGSQRLLAAAAKGEVLDTRLWTAVAAATGARGNTTALVGTPEQVAESMLAYYDLGVTTFLIRGFDPLEDAIDYGRELIPIVRSEIARREGQRACIRRADRRIKDFMPTKLLAIVGSVTPPGRLLNATQWLLDRRARLGKTLRSN